MGQFLAQGRVRGFVVISPDFAQKIKRPGATTAPVLVITDGAEPDAATWRALPSEPPGNSGSNNARRNAAAIFNLPSPWSNASSYNPSAESRNYLIPGSITVIMTVIGALLTSLVVAREWERGTMEALLASPVTRAELLLSKLLPYYALGMLSLLICVAVSVWLLHVPFRGSLVVLWLVGSLFLGNTLAWDCSYRP